jgi:hypothetical protein
MQTAFPSVSSRTPEFTPRELRLLVSREDPRPIVDPISPGPERLLDSVRRWLEEVL